MNNTKPKIRLSPFFLVMLSFVIIILLGSFLLTLPFANKDGNWGSYIDALFLATSGTCVTGLVSYADGVSNHLTFFGQLVLIICVQIGGLGFFTIFAFIVTLFKRKIAFKNRYTLTQAVGGENMNKVKTFIRKIILITVTFELIGFGLTLPVFYPVVADKGEAIWLSIFHSISAYNNAGFDLFGNVSLIYGTGNSVLDAVTPFWYNYFLFITMFLIIAGGISFLTVIDVFNFRKKPKQWRAFTKIALITSFSLIIIGWATFLLTDSIKSQYAMTPLDALFHSVSLRTAGFSSYDQSHLSFQGRIFSCLFMFIGGSPLSTAGGVKVTTIFIVALSIVQYLRNKPLVCFNRHFSNKTVFKSMTLIFIALMTVLVAFGVISGLEVNNPTIVDSSDILFECFSAFGTVGNSVGITSSLSVGSKITIILLMFIGRLGPITFFQLFENNTVTQSEKTPLRYIEEDVSIG